MSQLSLALPDALQAMVSRLSNVPLQSWQRGICALLLLWLLSGVADLVWLLLAPEEESNRPVNNTGLAVVGANPVSSGKVDIAGLQSLNLFGNASQLATRPAVKATPTDGIEDKAARTKLNVKLQGLVYSDNTAESRAMIAFKNKEEQYGIGDKLPVGNRVTLAKVLTDRVILNNNGRYEVLWLYDNSKLASPAKKSSNQANNRVTRQSANAVALAKDYRKRVYENPQSLLEVIKITPARKGGKMLGYRVSPGRDKKQFSELGFKPNDIITAVNSIMLDDSSQAIKVYKVMQEATEASFDVLRGSETLQISVSLQDNN